MSAWIKYPRTAHLPWSESITDDDKLLKSLDGFKGRRVIVTEKMDGENTSMYRDYIHARSLDGRSHISRDWVKQFHSTISRDIPEGWRVCGENMYAKHSIHYENLSSYFYGFSIWTEKNVCLSWDQTSDWFALLGINVPPVLYDGIYSEATIKGIELDWEKHEGYVLRIADEIPYSQFRSCVGKFVRKDHVMTVKHWMHGQAVEKNLLTSSPEGCRVLSVSN